MRSFLIGLFAGILLSALRAPVGLELLQIPAPAAGAALAFRAAALMLVALGLILGLRSSREALSPVAALFGAAVGYQLHWQLNGVQSPYALQLVLSLLIVTLLVAGHRGGSETRPRKGRIVLLLGAALIGWFLIDTGFPEGHGEAVGVGLCGLLSIAIVGRCTGKDGEVEAKAEEGRLAAGSLSGLAICGAGISLTLESLTRNTRLLGGGLPADDSLFGSVFFLFALIAAVAFTRNIKSAGATGLARAIVGACTAVTALTTLRSLENLGNNRGLDLYMNRSDPTIGEFLPFTDMTLDLSTHGMIEYNLALAGPLLVMPGFLAGAMIGLMRKPVELAALLVGAAGGLALLPGQLEFHWQTAEIMDESTLSTTALFGVQMAAVGVLLLAWTEGHLSRGQRLFSGLVGFAALSTGLFAPTPTIKILSPWEKRIVNEVVSHDIPAGFVTVELDPGGMKVATLNRHNLTPTTPEVPAAVQRMKTSWAMLGEVEEGKNPRVLFVGQLDPARALALVDLGAGPIDRTGSWSEAMGLLEDQLFDGKPNWFPGEILSIAAARARLDAGEYDLVIVPPVKGSAPTTRNLGSPKETTVVVWFDAGAGMETQYLGKGVLLSAPGLTDLFVGVARGPQVEEVVTGSGWGRPKFHPIADPLAPATAMEILNMRESLRGDFRRGRFADRLKAAERSPGLGEGLAIHFQGQTISSPFASEIDSIELMDEASQRFSEAAAGAEPSAFAVELIETLAHLLRAQRRAEEIDQFLIPPAERHKTWPALEVALAQSALEFLEPEAAVEGLNRVHATGWSSLESLAMLADAQTQTGDHHGAAANLDLALKVVPHHGELERRRAMALARAGDQRAAEALQHALEENPDDEELKRFLDVGPYPAPAAGYHPLVSTGAHNHDHGGGGGHGHGEDHGHGHDHDH